MLDRVANFNSITINNCYISHPVTSVTKKILLISVICINNQICGKWQNMGHDSITLVKIIACLEILIKMLQTYYKLLRMNYMIFLYPIHIPQTIIYLNT